ncbi:MAG: LuxR C-terminal-related transcriptional regulator [Cyanobacteria bacterium J06632_22]
MTSSSAPAPQPPVIINQLLASALDHLVDGLIIVTAAGHVVKRNAVAIQMCADLTPAASPTAISPTLWTVCRPIFKNIANGLTTHFGLEADLRDQHQRSLRVRVQILDAHLAEGPCLLLVLEDRQATYHRQAQADARRFGLTPREREVWELRLQGASYDAIAGQLWITENTVKKHMKSILAKRRLYEDRPGQMAS